MEDTRLDQDLIVFPQLHSRVVEGPDLFFQAFCFRHYDEMVVGKTEDVIVMKVFCQQIGDALQDLIADAYTEIDIVIFEVGDIKKDQGVVLRTGADLGRFQHNVAAFDKTAHAGQAGELVDVKVLPLGLDIYKKYIKDLPVFRVPE